jgi:L-malate glycosyltransferase
MGGTPVTELVVSLLQQSVNVLVVTLDTSIRMPMSFRGDQLEIRVGPYRPRHRARDFFSAEREFVRDTLTHAMADVAHAHWTYEYALGALASGLPTLITVHDWAPRILQYDPTPYRLVRLMMNYAVLARAISLTAPSPYLQRQIRKWTGRNSQMVPNLVAERSDTDKWTRLIGVQRSPQIVAVNNGFSRFKNVMTLLAAFPLVRQQIPGARLRLVGSGYGAGGPAHEWASKRNLSRNVYFQGPVRRSHLGTIFRSADLFVHPSLEESFGYVLIEAMAEGLPIVAGAGSGAVPWILDEGSAGVLTDVTSTVHLADAVVSLLSDDQAMRHLSSAGYQRSDAFLAHNVLPAYLDAYAKLVM